MKKYFTRVLILSLILVLGLTIGIAYAQGIGTLGLGDPLDPSLGLSEVYWFTGVHSEVVGTTKFATAVHCTNASLVDVETVYVQFFVSSPDDANDYTYASAPIPANDTVTFSSRPIDSFDNEHSPPLSVQDIQHGSGRVLSTNESGSRLICTVQALSLDNADGDAIIDVARLHLYDEQGNLISPGTPAGAGGDIFLPVIFKN